MVFTNLVYVYHMKRSLKTTKVYYKYSIFYVALLTISKLFFHITPSDVSYQFTDNYQKFFYEFESSTYFLYLCDHSLVKSEKDFTIHMRVKYDGNLIDVLSNDTFVIRSLKQVNLSSILVKTDALSNLCSKYHKNGIKGVVWLPYLL